MTDPVQLLGGDVLFTDQQLLGIYFFYGLGFLILGSVVFLKQSRLVSVKLTRSFRFLGAFGIVHGLNEWLDLTRMWLQYTSETHVMLLDFVEIAFLVVSYTFLMQFAVDVLTLRFERQELRWIPAAALVLFTAVALPLGDAGWGRWTSRHVFGLAGPILATAAFIQIRELSTAPRLAPLHRGATLMAVAFGVYTVFSGIATFPVAGIPPQFFRMLCSLLAAYASFDLLTILETGLGKGA